MRWGAPWLGASVSPFYIFTETYHLFPCPPLLLTPQIYFLTEAIFRWPSAYDTALGSVGGGDSRADRGGPALGGGLPRTAAPGWQLRFPHAWKVLSNVCWLLWLLLISLVYSMANLLACLFFLAAVKIISVFSVLC